MPITFPDQIIEKWDRKIDQNSLDNAVIIERVKTVDERLVKMDLKQDSFHDRQDKFETEQQRLRNEQEQFKKDVQHDIHIFRRDMKWMMGIGLFIISCLKFLWGKFILFWR